jgi:hypothetical protein
MTKVRSRNELAKHAAFKRMRAYSLHLDEDGSLTEDEEGSVLSDDTTAHSVALPAARDLLAGAVL